MAKTSLNEDHIFEAVDFATLAIVLNPELILENAVLAPEPILAKTSLNEDHIFEAVDFATLAIVLNPELILENAVLTPEPILASAPSGPLRSLTESSPLKPS